MSKERELLKRAKLLMECTDLIEGTLIESKSPALIKDIEELLVQPEQEPRAWMVRDAITGEINLEWYKSEEDEGKPLYTSPVREPNRSTTVYVCTAYRWGDREKHSYVVGVFDDLERAVEAAIAEREYRGKYECEVVSMPLNASKQNRQHKVEYKIDAEFNIEKL
jgi:hypothetical protein